MPVGTVTKSVSSRVDGPRERESGEAGGNTANTERIQTIGHVRGQKLYPKMNTSRCIATYRTTLSRVYHRAYLGQYHSTTAAEVDLYFKLMETQGCAVLDEFTSDHYTYDILCPGSRFIL